MLLFGCRCPFPDCPDCSRQEQLESPVSVPLALAPQLTLPAPSRRGVWPGGEMADPGFEGETQEASEAKEETLERCL